MAFVVDASFFARYDALGVESQSMHGIEAQLASANQALAGAHAEHRHVQEAHAANLKKQADRKSLIEECETSWFFGTTFFQPQLWFKGGVAGKIERQKTKLAIDEENAPKLAAQEQQIATVTLPPLEQQAANLQNVNNRKQAVDAERSTMFESAVGGMPSAEISRLQGVITMCQQQVQFEQVNAAILEQVSHMVAAAKRDYHDAQRCLREAETCNHLAEFENLEEMEDEGRRHEMRERLLQEHRDREMRRAQREADEGASKLANAFGMIPVAARERYPALCAQLGTVQLPQLQQTSFGTHMLEAFGGEFGDMIAGMQSESKIRQNMQLVGRCEHIVVQQEGMVHALLQQLRVDGANAAQNLQQSETALSAEKSRHFETLRAQFCGGVPLAQPAPQPMPMATVAQPMPTAAQPVAMPMAMAAHPVAMPMPTAAQPVAMPMAMAAQPAPTGQTVPMAMALPIAAQ